MLLGSVALLLLLRSVEMFEQVGDRVPRRNRREPAVSGDPAVWGDPAPDYRIVDTFEQVDDRVPRRNRREPAVWGDPAVDMFEQVGDRVPRRNRREPAVWGDPAPDYRIVVLDQVLINFVDEFENVQTAHYQNDMVKLKREVLKTVEEANTYFYQINIRIVVVDILQTQRSDLSLYTFEEYRNTRLKGLATHDFAALLAHRYAGGLAFVGAMCTSKSVMLCGFYPHDPLAMGSIFFHEVSHLLGVAHLPANESLNVENCPCRHHHKKMDKYDKEGCLRIPGFDHDCTLQQLANILGRSRCLKELRYPEQAISTSALAICGNGVLEPGEECDCGLAARCANWNCRPWECRKHFADWIVWTIASVLLLSVVSPVVYYLYHVYCLSMLPDKWTREFSLVNLCSCRCRHSSPERPFTRLKRRLSGRTDFNYPIRCRANYKYGQTNRCLAAGGGNGNGKGELEVGSKASSSTCSTNSILLFVDKKRSINRPDRPPPPPPRRVGPKSVFAKDRSKNPSRYGMVVLPMLINKFDEYETPITVRGVSGNFPLEDSISHKFDDFDEFDSTEEFDLTEESETVSLRLPPYVQGTVTTKRKLLEEINEDSRCLLDLSSSSSSGESLVPPPSSTQQPRQSRIVEEMIKRFNESS